MEKGIILLFPTPSRGKASQLVSHWLSYVISQSFYLLAYGKPLKGENYIYIYMYANQEALLDLQVSPKTFTLYYMF